MEVPYFELDACFGRLPRRTVTCSWQTSSKANFWVNRYKCNVNLVLQPFFKSEILCIFICVLCIAFGKISLILNGFFLRWNPSKEYLSMLLSSEELAKDMVRISNSGICIFCFDDQRKVSLYLICLP